MQQLTTTPNNITVKYLLRKDYLYTYYYIVIVILIYLSNILNILPYE